MKKKKKNEKYFNKITVKNAKRGDCFIQQQITRILYYKGSWSLQLHAQNTYVIKCHRHYFWTTWRNPFELVSMGFILFCDFIIFIQIIGVFWWLLYAAPVCSPFSSNLSSIHAHCSCTNCDMLKNTNDCDIKIMWLLTHSTKTL